MVGLVSGVYSICRVRCCCFGWYVVVVLLWMGGWRASSGLPGGILGKLPGVLMVLLFIMFVEPFVTFWKVFHYITSNWKSVILLLNKKRIKFRPGKVI